ncbi:MAG: hypothetical protein F6J93_09670 [Oscillatoria sp. SIO1A7]|nr:hypothetical protein [Oscillatoria sp. SIO1A7]
MTLTKDIATATESDQCPSDVNNFTTTIKRVLELLELEEEDDYGILKPTEYAFQTAMQLVLEAYEIMGNRFPRGSTCTDEQGGISITWQSKQPKRAVILFCPCSPEKPAYIYRDTQDDHGSEDVIFSSTLAGALAAFSSA